MTKTPHDHRPHGDGRIREGDEVLTSKERSLDFLRGALEARKALLFYGQGGLIAFFEAVEKDARAVGLLPALSGDSSAPETTRDDGAWVIHYEDRDRLPEHFSGAGAEEAARGRLQQVSGNWNCHLFKKVAQNFGLPSAQEAPAQPERKWRGIVAHDPKECGPCHVELQGIEHAQKASAPVGDFLRRLDDDKQAQADVDAENGKGDSNG